MAKEKISELTAAAVLDGTELVPVVQDGETVRTTTQDIADLGGGGGAVEAKITDFTANGASGTVYTNEGGAFVILATIEAGKAVVYKYHFMTLEANSVMLIGCATGEEIVFWDGTEVRATNEGTAEYIRLNGQGRSLTVVKLNDTQWGVLSGNAFEYYVD